MIGDCCPHPQSIILAEVACGSVGADLEVVVAGVWAGGRKIDGVGSVELVERRVERGGSQEAVAGLTVHIEAQDAGADNADNEIDRRAQPSH